MLTKDFPACVKAEPADGDAPGTFEAIVSVFGNRDKAGDIVVAGAFADDLTRWKDSGNPIPVLWSHRMDDPMFNIGKALDAAELAPGDTRIPDWAPQHVKDNGGLWVRGQLDTDADASPVARQAHRLMQQKRVTQFSFAYDVLEGASVKADGRESYELRKLTLHEISPTLVGCNDLTLLVGAKADGGPVPAAAAELLAHIQKAHGLLTELLAAIEPERKDVGGSGQVKAEEPCGAKAEEPLPTAGSIRLLCDLGLAEVS